MHPRAYLGAYAPVIDSKRHKTGGSALFPPTNILQTLVELKGDDEVGGVVTVVFDAAPEPPLVAGTDTFRARGIISWGVGGHMHEAEIDIRDGTMVSMPASYIRANAANEGLGATLRIGATACYLPRGGRHRPTRTRYRDLDIPGAATVTFAIPVFAADLTVMRMPNSASYRVRFVEAAGRIVGEMRVAAAADLPIGVPIPNDARTVDLVNDGVAITAARAIFGLAL